MNIVNTPYYSSSRATLYLGDCREIAPTLEPRSIDLMIADPPYGVSWRSGRRTERFEQMAGDDGSVDWPAVLGGMVTRLLRNHRHVYVFGYDEQLLVGPLQLGGSTPLIWDKQHLGPGNLSLPWGPEHEVITFGFYEWSKVNRSKGSGRMAARLRQGSVIRAPRPNSGQVRHPSEKPVPLLRQLIESSSVLGETVLDPTCGVGSTLVAAILSGRFAIGIELDEKHADIAVDRIQRAEKLAAEIEAS